MGGILAQLKVRGDLLIRCACSGSSDGGKAQALIKVDIALLKFVLGKREEGKRAIEAATGSVLTVPTKAEIKKQAVAFVGVEGSSEQAVGKAVAMVENAIAEGIESRSLDYSHFVSFPLALYPDLVQRLEDLRAAVLRGPPRPAEIGDGGGPESADVNEEETRGVASNRGLVGVETDGGGGDHVQQTQALETGKEVGGEEKGGARERQAVAEELPRGGGPQVLHPTWSVPQGVDASIFIKPRTFHLTVQMLKLWNAERVERAAQVLQDAREEVLAVLGPLPLHIRLGGLTLMRGKPAKAHVLYARVEEEGNGNRLLGACEVLMKAYRDAGLVTARDHQQRQLKVIVLLLSLKFHPLIVLKGSLHAKGRSS
eukprot:TRINITY_DN2198_c0_g1_i3.p1 TRINITY_DN2198_c0_g1~~TRINITY_DN2198_c0_g1_i3.p1  ORF type:complete len:370 (-),score=87.30 TRINITY_DN2198_c0_g1_i3:718-1827(-)